MTGSSLQKINGILLLSSFFGARIVSGTYFSYLFWGNIRYHKILTKPVDSLQILNQGTAVPNAIVTYYLVSNLILNGLNFFWFYKMILSLQSRFKNKQQ